MALARSGSDGTLWPWGKDLASKPEDGGDGAGWGSAWAARVAIEAGRWGAAIGLFEGRREPLVVGLSARLLASMGKLDEARARARGLLLDRSASAGARALATAALADALEEDALTATRLALRETAIALVGEDEAPALRVELLFDAAAATLSLDADHAHRRLDEAEAIVERTGLVGLGLRLEALRALASANATDGASIDPVRVRAESTGHVQVAHELLENARAHLVQGGRTVPPRLEEARLAIRERLALSLDPEQRSAFVRAGRTQLGRGEVQEPSTAGSTRDERLARLLEISKKLALEEDLGRLLERITESAVALSGAERGLVLRMDGGELQPVLVHGAPFPKGDPAIGFSRSIAEAVLIDGEPIVTVDARRDGRLVDFLSVHRLSLRSVACLPIRSPAEVMGALYLEHRFERGRFAERDLELLMAFADHAGIAIARTERLAALASREAELAEKARSLVEAKAELERVLSAREVELTEARVEVARAREALTREYGRYGIIGRSEAIRRAVDRLERVASSSVPVVIKGESGTGKELAARALHAASHRAGGAFVPLNCAAVPEGLLESELFGHVRGAFTGAVADRAGVFMQAKGGTLFLDEVGDMPPAMQVKLLRVLQEGVITPVGGARPLPIDARVVCATQRPLASLDAEGRFRADLYYRLHVIEVELPPLRARREDIPPLVDHLLARIAAREGGSQRRLSRRSMAALLSHPLPGNVRQLEHLLANAYLLSPGDELELEVEGREPIGSPGGHEAAVIEGLALSPPDADRAQPVTFDAWKTTERGRILGALEAASWNRAEAARRLEMPRRTFYRRLREYGIQ
jgi:transcriptional regulator with GAF, ATPase, and Fis domain